jgi:hypothetical protein
MPVLNVRELNGQPPRQPTRRNSYAEQTDEAGKLLDDEPVEIEREFPAGDNSPIERAEPHRRPPPPLFEE